MTNSGLIVRRSERFEISLPARVRVAGHHTDQLSFAKGVAGSDRWVEISIVDFASGGMGFVAGVFMPRNLDLELEIMDFQDPEAPPLLSCTMKIKRVQMTDRRPAYQIGCSFIEVDEEIRGQIDALIAKLRGLADTATEGGETDDTEGGRDVGYL